MEKKRIKKQSNKLQEYLRDFPTEKGGGGEPEKSVKGLRGDQKRQEMIRGKANRVGGDLRKGPKNRKSGRGGGKLPETLDVQGR